MDWAVVEEHRVVENTMKGWAMKKMREYLGEEEQTLTDFILTKLHKVSLL